MTIIEHALEGVFEKIGRVVGTHPVKTLIGSVIFAFACCGGVPLMKSETRPEKQWVPAGSLAIDHNEYVSATWPSNANFNLFTATCADVGEAECNILDPKYIQRFYEINSKIMNLTVDGDTLVADIDKRHKRSESDPDERRPWSAEYSGDWSYMGKAKDVNGSVVFEGRACFSFGPFCGKQSLLDVFRDDPNVINNLDGEKVKRAVNFWENQEGMCPLSIATAGSPCFDNNCQKYNTPMERWECRKMATNYCNSACPTNTFTYQGEEVTVPVDMDTCMDRGCIQLGRLSMASTPPNASMLNTDPNATGEAPESAFEFEPSKLKTMVGAIGVDSAGLYSTGKHLSGYYALNKRELFCPSVGMTDPLADEWERHVLCFMGIDADPRATPKLDCPEDDLLQFTGLFGRSFGDEFGAAIRGDIAKLSSSYFVIIIYCAIMVGKRDAIHSGVVISVVAVLIVGFTIGSTMGLMGYFSVPNSNLNSNLYFLILGLGVDDAFVLTSEFTRHTTSNPDMPISERIARTAKTGGISVLITSATDALAFLVGATTVLPALGWFCTYAGTAIILCFIFQLTVFLPALALNARRADASYRDCCCCCKANPPRAIDDPQGCCDLCCTPRMCGDNLLRRSLKYSAEKATTLPGQIGTIIFFVLLAGAGIAGSTMIYKDFKLEWFIPDTSYVNQFFTINSENFASGTKISVNMRATPDAFDQQSNLRELYGYLNTSTLVNQDVDIDSWYEEFMEWAVNPNQAATASMSFTPSRSDPKAVFADRTDFYSTLYLWYRGTPGSRFRGNLRWKDDECNIDGSVDAVPAGCVVTSGLKATRFNAELTLEATDLGTTRYDTMITLRADIDTIYKDAFPYSFDFLYWEEVGIIDVELLRNLIICGAVILVVVAVLVPSPRISVWVIVCIVLSIVDTLGFMYFWGVTISGVSTIYILICVGLAVDYAAHIAHMFKESIGTPRERAILAVERIGPCTFNAVVSTFLAVVVVGFSSSYIFRIFFKVLFLVVVIAGAHGLWLLPVVLSIFGGSKEPAPAQVTEAKAKGDAECGTAEQVEVADSAQGA